MGKIELRILLRSIQLIGESAAAAVIYYLKIKCDRIEHVQRELDKSFTDLDGLEVSDEMEKDRAANWKTVSR